MKIWLSLFASLILNTACVSTSIIKDRDYSKSLEYFDQGHYDQALTSYPDGEAKGFLTTLEQEWLDLAATGSANADHLLQQTRFFEERKITSITRDSQRFFIANTEEGYLPSEHEVVVHHLTTAMILLEKNKFAEARVETLRASLVLQNEFDQNNIGFDDPALRIWSGSLWLVLGEKNSAQVDFRRALALTKDPTAKTQIQKLLMESLPEEIHIAFQGPGPELKYGSNYPPSFDFNSEELDSVKLVIDNENQTEGFLFSTAPWFEWHQKRALTLRDFAEKSNYMTQFTGIKTVTYTERSAAFLTAHSVSLLGIALGTSIFVGGAYLGIAAHVDSAEYYAFVAGIGWSTAKYFVDQGSEFNSSLQTNISISEEQSLARLRAYRYLRFMPTRIIILPSQKQSFKMISLKAKGRVSPQLSLGLANKSSKVFFYWLP